MRSTCGLHHVCSLHIHRRICYGRFSQKELAHWPQRNYFTQHARNERHWAQLQSVLSSTLNGYQHHVLHVGKEL